MSIVEQLCPRVSFQNRKFRIHVRQLVLCLVVVWSGSGAAEEREATRANNATIEEIVVTATKREQTLQEIPVSVSVVSGDEIEKAQIQDVLDLQSLVPSLTVAQRSSSASTNFLIRGFGNGALNAGIEPSVGVFIDGVYRSRAAASISDFANVQRIEVLRGPQSALFGKNASAGVVSITTREPSREFGGSIAVTAGNHDTQRVRAEITGPLTDSLAYSLHGTYHKRDGLYDDKLLNTDINDRDRWGLRGQLLFEPNDALKVRVIADYDEIDEACCVASNVVTGAGIGGLIAILGGMVDENDPFSFDVASNFLPSNEYENYGASVQVDYELESARFTSITSYRENRRRTISDGDFTGADLVRTGGPGGLDTFTQEFRLTSSTDGPIEWTVGAYIFDETLTSESNTSYGQATRPFVEIASGGAFSTFEPAFGLAPGEAFQAGQGDFVEFELDNFAWSVFTSIDWHISDRFTATLGLNYVDDNKEASGSATNTDPFSVLDLSEIGVAVAGDPTAFNGFRGLQFFREFLDFPNVVEDGETNDDEVTYSLRLAFDLTDSVNVYASYGTGFKASSWNLARGSRPLLADFIPGSPFDVPPPAPSRIRDAGIAPVSLTSGTRFAAPEESEVVELGMKAIFETVSVNIALFDQSIEDFQSSSFQGLGFAFTNAGELSSRGVEVDLQWYPIEELALTAAVTYLDAEFDSFPNASSGAGGTVDLAGETPFGIADWSSSLVAQYNFEFGSTNGYARLDWQYVSEIALRDEPAIQALLDKDDTVINNINASIGFNFDNGMFLDVWGRNLTDNEYLTGAFPSVAQAGSISGYRAAPRTYGLTVGYDFD